MLNKVDVLLKRLLILFSLLTLCSLSVSVATDSTDRPEYMQVFEKHQRWEGYYNYNGTDYYCMFFIHSEHHTKKDGLLATLKDRYGATVEVEGESMSINELEVVFTVHTIFDNASRFTPDFAFIATLYRKNEIWNIEAQITEPLNGLWGRMDLHQSDDDGGPYFDSGPKAWHYFLIIGLPILLALIGVIGTAGILYWAIRKGYIRHVPKSYNSFSNSAGTVQYDSNRDAVHI